MHLRDGMRLLALLLITVLGWSTATSAAAIYNEGFEGWAVGAYPAPPWQNMFSGASAYVSDLAARSGVHSFRSESAAGWSRCDYVAMVSIPDTCVYRASVLVNTPAWGCGVGFPYVDPNAPSTFWSGNSVIFDSDGMIRFYSRSIGSVPLVPYLPGAWYDVAVQLDYTRLLADVYVNGNLVGHDLAMEPKILMNYGVPVPLDKFGVFGWNAAAGVFYVDDVALAIDGAVPARPATWGAIKALYR